jgi:hypothetical protein
VPPKKKWESQAARLADYRRRKAAGLVAPRRTATQYVYVLRAPDGTSKIGIAGDPAQRLRELQTGSPVILRLVGTIPGGLALERLLHRRFAAHRLHGEFFSPAIADELDALLLILDRSLWPNEKESS